LLELVAQRADRDAEDVVGVGAVAEAMMQGAEDEVALNIGDGAPDHAGLADARRGRLVVLRPERRQHHRVDADLVAAGEENGAVHGVLELAHIPALRERPRDVEILAEHFIKKYADANALPPRPLSAAARDVLTRHAWRGNVRELENTIHRAVLLADGAEIGIEAIELGPPASGAQAPASGGIASLVGRRMEEVERDLIIETLGHTLGNRTHAATILGISIRALRNKLRDYAAHGVMVPRPAAGVAA
jgi:hypothetical protein